MRAIWLKRILGILLGVAILAGIVWFAWPRPVAVDLASVSKGPMEVTVEDEGRTNVRHIYTVSAPIAGTVLRTPLHVGDEAAADETIVAVIRPTAPAFLDIRSREELQAALVAAEAAVTLAEHEVHRVEAALEFAEGELSRAEALADRKVISAKALDQAKFDVETNKAALASAKAQLEVRRSERASLAARLIDPTTEDRSANPDRRIELRAPVSGTVLRILQESEVVVQAGAPLVEIGDPLDLEVIADLLSTDAVRIEVGAPVRIDGWGGPPVQGRVKRVDPAGFVKVSALGIEEQRVRTTVDFEDPPDAWSSLGHDFRVIVHVTVWQGEDVLQVPVSALFRKDDEWAVFAVKEGRARAVPVQIGQRTNRVAEIVSGLTLADQVVLHPSDRVSDGTRVAERQTR